MSPAVSPKPPLSPASTDIALPTALPPSPPLSPKPTTSRIVLRILQLLRQLERGTAEKLTTTAFSLSQTVFADLERRITASERLQDYWTHKLRHDYDSTSRLLILRMPDAIHEIFIQRIQAALYTAVLSTADSLEASGTDGTKAAATELRRVFLSGNTTLSLEGVESSSQDSDTAPSVIRRSPDASFCHPSAGTNAPPLVVEVSYSQRKKELGYLADSYVVDSRHAVRCVLGFDLGYVRGRRQEGGKREASVSVWRAGVDEQGVGVCRVNAEGAVFRSDGKTVDGILDLTVADFLPMASTAGLSETSLQTPITIAFADLGSFLTDAEMIKAAAPPTVAGSAPTKFRKRKRTPSEELSDTREEVYAHKEAEELAVRQREDPEWKEECGLAERKVGKRRSRRRVGDGVEALASAEAESTIPRRRSGRVKTGNISRETG